MTLPNDYFAVTGQYGYGGGGYGWDHHYIHECLECLGIYESKNYKVGLCEQCKGAT